MDKEEIAKKNMVDKIKEEVKIMSRISTKYVVKLFYALHREKKVYLVSFFIYSYIYYMANEIFALLFINLFLIYKINYLIHMKGVAISIINVF